MRHVMGVVLLAAAACFFRSALERRRRAAEAARAGQQPPPLHPSLVLMADLGPSVVVFGLAVAGGQVALAFWLTGGGGVFSLLDLAGFVALLVAYGTWVKAKGRYRLPDSASIRGVPVNSPAQPAREGQPHRPAGGLDR